ncbi:MAG: hypothetical protein ACE15B_20775 [Bryobacteraceae bacterium]
MKDNKVIYSTSPGQRDAGFQFLDKGAITGRNFYYVRLLQDDGMIAWTSPFFVNYSR